MKVSSPSPGPSGANAWIRNRSRQERHWRRYSATRTRPRSKPGYVGEGAKVARDRRPAPGAAACEPGARQGGEQQERGRVGDVEKKRRGKDRHQQDCGACERSAPTVFDQPIQEEHGRQVRGAGHQDAHEVQAVAAEQVAGVARRDAGREARTRSSERAGPHCCSRVAQWCRTSRHPRARPRRAACCRCAASPPTPGGPAWRPC